MSDSSHIIREYSLRDKAACLTLFDSNVPQYFMPNERNEFIQWLDKTDRAAYYVMIQKEEIVACGGIYVDWDRQATGLAWGMVHHSRHKQGLGKVLTIHRLETMNEQFPGLDQYLETSQLTEAFYLKFGFETIERIKDGFGPGLDNCKMRKPDNLPRSKL